MRVPLVHPRFFAARAVRERRGMVINAMDTSPLAHPELKALLPGAALLVVPLLASGGEAVGALALREALDPKRFDEDDLERAQVFATQAAIAIETARLHDQLRVAREQAEAERARWRAAVDDVPQLVCTSDTVPRTTYANPAMQRFTGRPANAAVSPEAWAAHFGALLPDGSGPFPQEAMPFLRALRADRPVHGMEIRHSDPGGAERLVVWDAAPMRTSGGELLGAVAVGHDVTEERRRAQRERCLAAVTRAGLGTPNPANLEGRASRMLRALVIHAGVPVVRASLHLRDPETGAFRQAGAFGATMASDVGAAVAFYSHSLGWRALLSGPQYSAPDGGPPDWLHAVFRRYWPATDTRAWAAVPLHAGGEPFGALAVGLGTLHGWDDDERDWIEACGNALGLALQNDRLFAAERRRAKELQVVIEAVDAGITLMSTDGRMLLRNSAAAALTARPEYRGTLAQNAAAYGLRDAATGAPLQPEQSPVARALRGEPVRNVTLLMRDGQGQERVMLTSSDPVRDSRDLVVAAVSIFRDVKVQTRRAQLVERLSRELGASLQPAAEMRALVAALVDHGGVDTAAVYETASDGQTLRLLTAHNYPPAVAKRVQRIPADAPTIAALALRTGQLQMIQSWAELMGPAHALTRRLAGGLGAASGAALPLLARGRVVGVLVVGARRVEAFPPDEMALLLELSGRAGLALDNARLYQAARSTAAELTAIIDAMAEGVRVCDTTGQVTRINHAGVAFLGVPRERALQSREEYMEVNAPRWPDGRPIAPDEVPLARALRGESNTDYEMVLRHAATGQDLWVRSSYAPIHDESTGAIIGAVAVGRDVTQIKELERAREDLLAVVAHELKTPLTSLLGYLQAARRKQTKSKSRAIAAGMDAPIAAWWTDDVDELVKRVERQALRLDRLVSDLLDATRVQQGRLEYRWALGDLSGAIAESVDGQRAAHPDRRIEQTTPDEPLMVRLDADRIGQVVTNLVGNALKYSRTEQPVSVTVGVRADEAETTEPGTAGEAVVRVHDEGVGIPAEHQAHLFERFYRVPGVEVQSGSGIGLGVGLYVAQAIVTRHGGRLWVESEPGHGSTFSFTIPLAAECGM
jgi:PAS domain S-box-containing protein